MSGAQKARKPCVSPLKMDCKIGFGTQMGFKIFFHFFTGSCVSIVCAKFKSVYCKEHGEKIIFAVLFNLSELPLIGAEKTAL